VEALVVEVLVVVGNFHSKNMHPSIVQLEFYREEFFEDLNSFQLDEFQSEFTLSFYQNIVEKKIQEIPGKHPIAVLFQSQAIGFFVLDDSNEKFTYTTEMNSLLLRSLSLHPAYQGKGLGKEIMGVLDEFVQLHFPEKTSIYLAVNQRNIRAKELYFKTGYLDTGKIYVGIKGPQFILKKNLCD
jgi:GNAT superfamily N-acetyltransferase